MRRPKMSGIASDKPALGLERTRPTSLDPIRRAEEVRRLVEEEIDQQCAIVEELRRKLN